MANGIAVFCGSNILEGATVSALPGLGNQGCGQIVISGGQPVFPASTVVTMAFSNISATHEVDHRSALTEIRVYEHLGAFYANLARLRYIAGPGVPPARILPGLGHLGDSYLHLPVAGMRAFGPDAPHLTSLTVVAGQDLHQPVTGPRKIDRFTDYDCNGNSAFVPPLLRPQATRFDLLFNAFTTCFARGTRILTTDGEIQVEALDKGDELITPDGRVTNICWMSRRRVRAEGRRAPIMISAGCHGATRDLFVAPDHRIQVQGAQDELEPGSGRKLVPARMLVNDRSVIARPGGMVEYFHILCDQPELVVANGAHVETLPHGPAMLLSVHPDDRADLRARFPAFAGLGITKPTSRSVTPFPAQPPMIVPPRLPQADQALAVIQR